MFRFLAAPEGFTAYALNFPTFSPISRKQQGRKNQRFYGISLDSASGNPENCMAPLSQKPGAIAADAPVDSPTIPKRLLINDIAQTTTITAMASGAH
jgi:hypothetical protein